MGDYLPRKDADDQYGVVATAAITGGQLVNVQGAPTSAGDAGWFGVAAKDTPIGQRVAVFRSGIQRPIASVALALGDKVKPAANGQVAKFVPGTDDPTLYVGIVTVAQPTVGQQVDVAFNR